MRDDLISREYIKAFVCEYEKFNGKETEIVKAIPIQAIDNAPTVDITRKIQSELISEVSHSIARQFLEHDEVVPFWLSIGGIRIKEAENETDN